MAEMAEMLEEVAAGKARPVVLIEGDEYLARTSARELADAIVPEEGPRAEPGHPRRRGRARGRSLRIW